MDFYEEEPTQIELNPNPALHTDHGNWKWEMAIAGNCRQLHLANCHWQIAAAAIVGGWVGGGWGVARAKCSEGFSVEQSSALQGFSGALTRRAHSTFEALGGRLFPFPG